MIVRSVHSRKAALAILAAACTAPAAVRAQAMTLRIGAATADSFAEGYYAADQGAFAKAGIDATIATFPAGGQIVQAAAAGAIDVGVGDPIALANAAKAGVPLAYFAGSGLYTSDAPTSLMVVPSASPIRTAKDFEGQAIGVANLSSIILVAVKAWLERGGADLAKVKFFELAQSQLAEAAVRGTVAGAFVSETFISGQSDKLRILGACYDALAKQFLLSGWFAKRDWIRANPEVAKRYAQVMYDTARWANGHHDDTAAILSKQTGMELARIKAIHRMQYATSLDPKLLQPVLDASAKYKLLDARLSAADLIA